MKTEKPYQIKLPIFEGPFDLLLHLIKDNEINIYDIPIVEITQQYLEYVDIMKDLNLDVVGEYLVMAATLTHIKSKMLLPKPEVSAEEEQGEDPREELVRKLIEYRTFKDAAGFLREKEEEQKDIFMSTPESDDTEGEDILLDLNVFDLLGAFRGILKNIGGGEHFEVTLDDVSVTEKLNYIMDVLSRIAHVHFEELFSGFNTRMEVVATFLALLELMRLKLVVIQQATRFGPIIIFKAVEDDPDGKDESNN